MATVAFMRWMLIFVCLSLVPGYAETSQKLAYWTFDSANSSGTRDVVTNRSDAILGNFSNAAGVKGNALKFDGFTTRILREAKTAPPIHGAFTISAWIAPQAYPWNWNALVEQKNRYFFGLDATGHIGLRVFADDQWREAISSEVIPFMEWSYVAATFDPSRGLSLYINDHQVAHLAISGHLSELGGPFQIGRNIDAMPAAASRNIPASYSFDGLLDELKVEAEALNSNDIKLEFEATHPVGAPPLAWRKLPQVPDGQRRFGAFYTALRFYPEWDKLWRIDEYPDVVVTFDDASYKMVFWHGTNYNMNLVTENGRWIGDQSAEATPDEFGCVEHMSDKQSRYSHVRVIENTPARVVVHWRYALADVKYNIGETDPITGWGDWADEYYTIYPDAIAVRHFLVYGPSERYSITEPATLNNPGEKAENNVAIEAATLGNMAGESRTFSWETWPSNGNVRGEFFNAVLDANISIINTKSDFKPIYIYEPGTLIIPYGGGAVETRPWFSKFPIWNHWPVAQIPSDGRNALALDRVSSSAITSPEPPEIRREKDGALEGRFLLGLTNQPIDSLLRMARSWLQTPEMTLRSSGFVKNGYRRDDRAFHLHRAAGSHDQSVQIQIVASDASPLVNPAFVVDQWGPAGATIKLNGKAIIEGKDFRVGHVDHLEGTSLIIWIRMQATKPVTLSVTGS
jgi:hypothetical protein